MNSLDIVIPVFNEDIAVVRDTISKLKSAFPARPVTIIVVDDGSDEIYGLATLAKEPGITFVRHRENRGYGSALKTGILSGSAEWIGICDADETYPVDEFPALLERMDGNDMVIGVRNGPVREIPWTRRFPKRMLSLLASYMAGRRIGDLNSGMRIFSRDLAYYLWGFFPSGFSFTSTITMGAIMGGFRIEEHSINYFKRSGRSSIRPIKDTLRFFHLVCRLGLLFHPMKIFFPVSAVLFMAGSWRGLRDYSLRGSIGNLSTIILLAAIQIFMLGLLGKLIVHSRFLRRPRSADRVGSSSGKDERASSSRSGTTQYAALWLSPYFLLQ